MNYPTLGEGLFGAKRCGRLISEHIVARFLNYPDDAEWECHKESALAHLGWFEDDIDGLARGLAADLKEIHAYRGG